MAQRKINVLLLGETGVGKTTFINMLANYITNQSWPQLLKNNLTILAPTNFVYINKNFEEKFINLGSNENEVVIPGASSTQKPISYIYPLPEKYAILRVIDTPGIGDTRGLEFDRQNTQIMLRYISELEYLDAVCVFLKPSDSRLSVLFEYSLRVILKDLVPSIKNNFLFVFTRSRGSHYGPGDAYQLLKTAITNIQRETNTIIPLRRENVFCIDNEAFRYLAGRTQGIEFAANEVATYSESYNHSLSVTRRMIDFITTLSPIRMQHVATRNESKRIILRLAKPLISLVTNYEKAMVSMREYESIIQAKSSNLDVLKQNLFKIDHKRIVKEKKITRKHTSHKVGFGIGASFPPFMIGGNLDYNYTDDNFEEKMENVDFVENRVLDQDVYSLITDENTAQMVIRKKINEMEMLCEEYKQEVNVILEAIATFYVYCKENNLINEDYFKRALEGEKAEAELDGNQVVVNELGKMIQRYEIKKNRIADITPEDIKEVTMNLFRLKHSGSTFKTIMDKKFEFLTIEMK